MVTPNCLLGYQEHLLFLLLRNQSMPSPDEDGRDPHLRQTIIISNHDDEHLL